MLIDLGNEQSLMSLILFVAGPGGGGCSQRCVQRKAAGETVSNSLVFLFNEFAKSQKSFQYSGVLGPQNKMYFFNYESKVIILRH